ncbi:MAG: cation diffusion facilitator family transporter [Verrucomicrobiota bacterium]
MINAGKAVRIGLLTLCVNIVLAAVKIFIGIIGNSTALVADGIESCGDIFSSLITWVGFQLSLRPADDSHPYGHGKIESLAGMVSGVALLAAAALIAWTSLLHILTPDHSPEWFTLPVLLAVIVIKIFLSRMVFSFSGEVHSRALEGDALHHLSDAVTSGAAAIGITIALIGGKGWETADDYAALLSCLVIVLNGGKIIRGTLHEMLDGNVSTDLNTEMRERALEVPQVINIEKCRVRKSGIGLFVELHVQVDGNASVRAGHLIGHAVKDHLKAVKPEVVDVIIHLEPSDRREGRP